MVAADGGGVRPIHYIIMLYYEIIKRLEEKQQGRRLSVTVNGWKNDGGRMQGGRGFPFSRPRSVRPPVDGSVQLSALRLSSFPILPRCPGFYLVSYIITSGFQYQV